MPTTPILSLPYPVSTDSADVPRDIKALADKLDPLGMVPVGAMMMWPGASAPPGVNAAGKALWMLMQGQAVLAADYPGLATLFGQSGGNVTVPDMRDRFPIGASATVGLNAAGGAASVALATAHMPSHSHGGMSGVADRSLLHDHAIQNGAWAPTAVSGAAVGPFGLTGSSAGATLAAPSPDHLHAINAEGGGQAHENRPPFRGVNFIIRAG